MTTIKKVIHYAKNAHGQPNTAYANADDRIEWSNPTNASSKDAITQPKGDATSYYNYFYQKLGLQVVRPQMVFKKPWTFSAHDFGLQIPDCAYIKKITYSAMIKVDGTIKVNAPYARFNIYNGTKTVKTNIKDHTGWDSGFYYYNPNKKLTNNWQKIDYVMSGDDYRKRGYGNSQLNDVITGIDLIFFDATEQKKDSHKVHIQYVSCIVEYEMPDPVITFDRVTSGDNPRVETAGNKYRFLTEYRNNSNAGCCGETDKYIKITPPPHATITALNGQFNPETNEWKVGCTPNAYHFLLIEVEDMGIGLFPINFHNDELGDWNYWIYSVPSDIDEGQIKVYPNQYMQQGLDSCVKFEALVNVSDGTANFNVNMDVWNDSHPSVTWKLSDESTEGVSLASSDDTHVNFTVPRDTPVKVVWTGCFVPDFDGSSQVYVTLGEDEGLADYNVYPVPTFVVRNNPTTNETDRTTAEITLNPSIIRFITHRVATSTELGAYVIDCGIAPLDNEMVYDDCTLTANVWQKHNYIGMVELPFAHFDPQSTFENKEIWNSYKNKTYAGKEGIIDEEIDLNFRVPRKDTITLQGLVELDKPTPINANWRCFEGDPLNHRGWAVFSKLEVEETNPLYYKCKGTVKYITHDINTKFQIFRGTALNSTTDIPAIMADKFTIGNNLSTGLDVFNIETDGGFVYDEDGDEGAKNIFSLDEGQTLSIATKEPLSEVTRIRFDWYSNKIAERNENNLERIFTIRNSDGKAVLEYEYTNFHFDDEYVDCDVIIRVLDDMGGWKPYIFENVDLRTELIADPIIDGEDIDADTSYDIDVDTGFTFVNLDEIITDSHQTGYDANTTIATYNDESIREITITDGETTLYTQTITSTDEYIVKLSDLDLSEIQNDDLISFTCKDFESEEVSEYTQDFLLEVKEGSIRFIEIDDESEEAYEEDYIAPSFDPSQYDLTTIYGTSLMFEFNKNVVKIYDSGYNGREVVSEAIELVGNGFTFESLWTNNNTDGTTEDVISYIDIGISETILSADYSKFYENIMVSPFPIPHKTVVFTRESEEGTIYYLTGLDPFKYRIEPFYQYLCGTDLVTREGTSIFNLNNSHDYFYIENGLVRLGFNKYTGSLYLAKWDIVSKQWITTHYFHMNEDTKFSLEKYSDDKIVIKAGTDTYFSIWRGHPYIMIQNQTETISIDSKFNYCLADKIDGKEQEYPVIGSFMNDNNLLPVCIGGNTLDYDCIGIDDDEISGGTNHTITVTTPESMTAGEDATFTSTISPSTRDGTVHYIIDGVDIGGAEYPFSLTYKFPFVDKEENHTLQAVYTGDEDDNIAISDNIPIIVKAPLQRQGSDADGAYPEIPGRYSLSVTGKSRVKYRDGSKWVVTLKKGQTPVKGLIVERQMPHGATFTTHTDSKGQVTIVNDDTRFVPEKVQVGGRFYDNFDVDADRKLLYTALKWVTIEKATPTFTHNATDGKLNKGKYLHIKLNGVDSIKNSKKAGLTNRVISYRINGGSKQTKKTNDKGKIYIPFNKAGDYTIKLLFAGSTRYESIKKTFTIKVR